MKILIVRLSSIGDVVQGIPCLVALKKSFPTWEISWLVEETSAPILEGHPCIAKLFVLKRTWRKSSKVSLSNYFHGLSNIWQTLQAVRRERFDVVIDLQGLFKSGLWAWLSGAPRRLGHDQTREFAHCFLNEYVGARPTFDPEFPLLERYLEPARALGADPLKGDYLLPTSSPETVSMVDALLKWPDAGNQSPIIALCPWSAWPSKNWPMERWCEVARVLSKDFRVLILGSTSEKDAAEKICSNLSGILNLAGTTDLFLLPEIFRRCRLVIGPDTGPVHLANATGVPRILMLFGSTSWKRSGPSGKGHRTLSTKLSCQPCFKRLCPLEHLNCQQQLKVEDVLKLAQELCSGADGEP